MGPAPSMRSGHRMAAVGSRIYVLGGQSHLASDAEDPTVIHILDIGKYCN